MVSLKKILTLILMTSLFFTPSLFGKNLGKKMKKPRVSLLQAEHAIESAAKRLGVPYEVLRAICMTESNLNADAFVRNDGGDHNHAFGMCQVLRRTAEKYVKKDKGCTQDFSDRNLDRSHKQCNLFGPVTNALAAAHYLRYQMDRFSGDLFKAVAAYNAGSVVKCGHKRWVHSNGKKLRPCRHNDILNRYYVDRVEGFMKESLVEMTGYQEKFSLVKN
ncbi:MAG: transglycosylase SLT domain-containing protein [Oligoflexales bacterium]|nr:transglycosylase SLT domain-containing protein [Oligoflexales bacterium]